jgi:hypothetical protein
MASSTNTRPLSLHSIVVIESPESARPGRLVRHLPALTAAACIAFGLALIANTQLACDGGWFWYAVLHHGGTRLYRDLHLVLQPLAVLETEWWMDLAGKGWIASKVPACIHLVAFVAGIVLISAKSRLRGVSQAILIANTFFVGIQFEAYRFDDYHVMTDALALFSIFLLLKFDGTADNGSVLKLSAVLAVLSGLAITTRLTDGMALALTTAIAIAFVAKTRKLAALAAFSIVTAATVLAVVFLTGDSLRDYASFTIFHAAGPKGGLASVLSRPLLLFWHSLAFLYAWKQVTTLLYCAVAAASGAWLTPSIPKSDRSKSKTTIKPIAALALLGAIALLWPVIQNGDLIVTLSAVCVLAAYGIVAYVLYRLIRESFQRQALHEPLRSGEPLGNPNRVILLLPFSLLLTGSMSSAGYHFGLYAAIAFLILSIVVLFPAPFERRWVRSSFLALAALMAVSGAYSKAINPASWHTYRSFPMFAHRVVVDHPTYGPMVIDDSLNNFVGGICSIVSSGGKSDLLSIPFPYANYYCNIPPWQGFVQTFFDLSGKEVIDDMMAKLQQSPPKWILYQRQLENLAMHEKFFNNGKRLPQRDLDDFIVANVASGRWQLVMRGQDKAGSDWLLLRTK